MLPMTSPSPVSTLSAVGPTIIFLTTLLFANVHPSPSPIQLQRRQSFFRCTGWGAGCSHVNYAVQPASYGGGEPRRYEEPIPVLRPRGRFRPSGSSGTVRGSRNGGYRLGFLFTSGTSWGANGKRSSDSTSVQADSTLDTLHTIVNELRKRLSAQSPGIRK